MSLYTIKKVSELVPETSGLIKRASLENNLPTGTKDETLLSALELEYMMKVAHTHVDIEDAERVCRAVDLYGIKDEVKAHTETMVKSASLIEAGIQGAKQEVANAENFVMNELTSMSPNLEKVAEASEALWDEYSEHISSDEVKIYAGAGTLVKEAAVLALNHRASRTGLKGFSKLASIIEATNVDTLALEEKRAIVDAAKILEKEANYNESDIYQDMFISKEAAIMVNLGPKTVNVDMIKAASTHIGDALGADIGSSIESSDTMTVKHMVEALPLGERQVISGIV